MIDLLTAHFPSLTLVPVNYFGQTDDATTVAPTDKLVCACGWSITHSLDHIRTKRWVEHVAAKLEAA